MINVLTFLWKKRILYELMGNFTEEMEIIRKNYLEVNWKDV